MKNVYPVLQYSQLNISGFIIKPTLRDGVVLLSGGEIALTRNIIKHEKEILIVYQLFSVRRSLHDYPFSSSDIDMYIVGKLSTKLKSARCNKVEKKCVCMPLKDGREFAVVPFAHKE